MKYILNRKEDKSYYKRIIINDVFGVENAKNIENSCVIDIGAHIGLFSLKVAQLYNCNIFSYEPEQTNFDTLKKHVEINKLNNQISLYNEAIWEGNQNVLNLDNEKNSYDSHSLFKTENNSSYVTINTTEPHVIFDRVTTPIGYLKLNGEGCEYYVLKYLLKNKTLIDNIYRASIELHPGLLPESLHNEMIKMTKLFKKLFITKPLEIRIATYECSKKHYDKFLPLKTNTLKIKGI